MSFEFSRLNNLDAIYYQGSNKNLFCVLHGYGANFQDLVPIGEYLGLDSHHWLFLNGPVDLPPMYPANSRAWFPIDMAELEMAMMTGRHRSFADKYPEQIEKSLEQVEGVLRLSQFQDHNLVLLGFSQGAMMCSHLGHRLSEKIKAMVLFSGNILGESRLKESYASTENQFPVFQSHGNSDPVLGLNGATELRDFFTNQGHRVDYLEFSGGHEIPMEVLNRTKDFLAKNIN